MRAGNFYADFVYEKRTISEIVNKSSASNTIFGLLQYGNNATVEISLKEFTDSEKFNQKMNSMSWKTDGINLKAGLEKAAELFHKEGRPKARKVLVVFTDARVPDTVENVIKYREQLEKKGLKIITIAVGDIADDEHLIALSSKNKTIKPKESFGDLKKTEELAGLVEDEIFTGR